ncbi:MAG: hypothetical protein CW338_07145 [Clostridiales bacterium]|nr:hypothetical protein [Clostridiales bacterium]
MYQIFVVEDELLIRQNIRNIVEKLSGPYSFCGEASDGEIALSMMQDILPDILLTDIRMPFLDGFELIRHAKKMIPWLKVIIISGFDDFDYAKRAISLDVDSYLLKPVRAQELKEELDKIAARIESEKGQSVLPRGYDRDEVDQALRQHFMQQLLYSGSDTSTLLEKAMALKLDIIRSYYRTVILHFECEAQKKPLLQSPVRNELMEQGIQLYTFHQPDQLTILFYDNDAEQLNEKVYQFISVARHAVRDLCDTVTVVMAVTVERMSAIAGAYAAAADLLNKAGTYFAGRVLDAGDTAQLVAESADYNEPTEVDFLHELKRMSPDDVPGMLDRMLNGPEREQYDSMLVRYHTLIRMLKASVQVILDATPEADRKDIAEKLSESSDIFSASGSREAFRECAQQLLQTALRTMRGNSAYLKHNYVISRAEEYVKQNFCNPNITLISVAEHIHMSPAHFSTVFSQTVGKPFIAYLTSLRIEKAKELLASGDMKLSDIAMEIGYNEPNYFSHVFRKAEGMTPKEYRNRMMSDTQNPARPAFHG